jgi:FkbM family methyltransferase
MILDYLQPTPNWQYLITSDRPVILDIGCNDGGHSRIFQGIFPAGMIYAFEPDLRAISHCKYRLQIGQLDSARFELFEVALSDESGETLFHPSGGNVEGAPWYDTGWDLSGSLLKPNHAFHPVVKGITFDQPVTVATLKLNDWLAGRSIPNIDLMWMDVQGAELKVLKGGTNALTKTRYIYLECEENSVYSGEPTLQEIVDFLEQFYFERIISYPDGNHLFKRLQGVM